jgi:Do/DeqQ family serine protease
VIFYRAVVLSILALCIYPACLWATPSRETPVVRAVRKIGPAVVNISSEYEVRKRTNPFSGFGMDPLFDSFFKDFFDPGFERRYKRTSLGSGIVIDGKRGFIITNAHVITRSGKISVTLQDERVFDAQVVGADPDSDLSVLKIVSDAPLPSVALGDSDDLMIGESVIAIGNPFGFSHTVTTGVISALNRSIRTEDRVFRNFIQTDASINPGNSGGPLLNINGDLIGINTAIYAKAQGIGFAIPINRAKRIISDLIRHGEVVPAWLGVYLQNLKPDMAHYLKVPEQTPDGHTGVLVRAVAKDSPAAQGGIRKGDVILTIGRTATSSLSDFQAVMLDFAPGDRFPMTLWRDGRRNRIVLTAAAFPLKLAPELTDMLLGIQVGNLTTDNRRQYQIQSETGVLITHIRKTAHLFRIGARTGDVIRQIDEVPVSDRGAFEKAIIKYRLKSSVVVLLQRANQLYNVTVDLH